MRECSVGVRVRVGWTKRGEGVAEGGGVRVEEILLLVASRVS